MLEQMNEGCKVYGFLEVSKVAGNVHFAPGKSFQQHSMHGKELLLAIWEGKERVEGRETEVPP